MGAFFCCLNYIHWSSDLLKTSSHFVQVVFVVTLWWGTLCQPVANNLSNMVILHDDVIKWKHSPRYWPFVRGIHRSPVNSPHKGQWRGALMFSLNCIWLNGWVNNGEAGDLRHYRALCDIIVMTHHGLFCSHAKYNYTQLGLTVVMNI